jgi:TIR domain-containing protein/rhodanese-like protein
MTHDVFISHSTLDKLAADAVCHGLEAKGVRCWMAPRDQIAGKAYGQQITEAIRDASVMVLVFSEHVNDSQAVLNEINLAAAASVTIVPFRIASVAFNPELNYYLGRTHWLDAFPQPVDAYIDALATTVRRNLPPPAVADAAPAPPAAADAGAAAAAASAAVSPAPSPPPPPSPPSPPAGPAAALVAAAHPPHRHNYMPAIIVGLVFAFVLAIVLIGKFGHKRSPAEDQATTTIAQAVANAIQTGAKDDTDKSDQDGGAQAAAGGPLPPRGDGSELTPLGRPKPAFVKFYQTELMPGGPPEGLQGATVINTRELVQTLRERDAGMNPVWLIDARGCTEAPTLPTAQCLAGNSVQELQAKVPNKAAPLVLFGQDGANPAPFNLATQAVAAGYSNVLWYRGGVSAWTAAGEPTVARSAGGGQ